MKVRKAITILIPVAAAAMVIAIFGVLETRRPPNWRLELDEYLSETAVSSGAATVQSVVQAQQPWNFNPTMASAVLTGWRWRSIDIPPPKEIKCVLLERVRRSTERGEETRRQQVVLVGYHTDMLWNDSWVVHELNDDSSAEKSMEMLAMLGCDLDLVGSEPRQ